MAQVSADGGRIKTLQVLQTEFLHSLRIPLESKCTFCVPFCQDFVSSLPEILSPKPKSVIPKPSTSELDPQTLNPKSPHT